MHVTFFLIGTSIEKGEQPPVRQMARDGHLIGNHTYHHVQLTKIKEEEALKELEETNRLIREDDGKSGRCTSFWRISKGTFAKISIIPVMWTVDPLDWSVKDTEKIVSKVVTQAKENDMILLNMTVTEPLWRRPCRS